MKFIKAGSGWAALALATTTACVLLQATRVSAGTVPDPKPSPAVQAQAALALGQLPLSFEPNRGQTDARVAYLAHGSGYTLFLSPDSATFELQRGSAQSMRPPAHGPMPAAETAVIRMDLVGADGAAPMQAQQPLPGIANYLAGSDRSRWITALPTFAQTRAAGVYPGVDLVYYGTQGRLEYDFIVAPRADPSVIHLAFAGAKPTLTASGDLVLALGSTTGPNDIRFQKPLIYQQRQGVRQPVDGRFAIGADQQVSFEVGAYDHSRELVIDPVFAFSSYLGGSSQQSLPYGMALNSSDDIYLVGITNAVNFPTTPGVIFPSCPASTPGIDTKCGPSSLSAAFVSKIAANGQSLIYSTYLGGSGGGTGLGGVGSGADYASAVAVGPSDQAWIYGSTNSNNFPITANAYQIYCTPSAGADNAEVSDCGAFNGGHEYIYGLPSLFLVQLNSTGTDILYGTFLGGTENNAPAGIVLDSAQNIYIAGVQYTCDLGNASCYLFPITASAYQQETGEAWGAFVTELSAGGQSLVYSTTFSGATNTDTIYVTGPVLANGLIVIGGATNASPFPTTSGAISSSCPTAGGSATCYNYNAFVAAFDPTKSGAASLVFSTYLNGANPGNFSEVYGVAADSEGNIYAVGADQFPDFPATAGVLQPSCHVQGDNGYGYPICNTYFVTKLSNSGALIWSTFYGSPSGAGGTGGAGSYPLAITVDSNFDAYIVGQSFNASDLPMVNPVQYDGGGAGFVMELNPTATEELFGSFYGSPTDSGIVYTTAIALDSNNNPVFTGYSNAPDLPLVNALQSTDAGGFLEGFFTKINMSLNNGAAANPTSLSFGQQPTGAASVPQTITVTNSGSGTLNITSVTLSGANVPAFGTSTTCGAGIGVGGTCTVTVTFTPPAIGAKSAVVNVASNASGSPLKIAVNGTGITPTAGLSVSPASLAFGNQEVGLATTAQTLTVTNTTTAMVTINSIGLAGLNVPAFASTNACGSPLPSGTQCTIGVTFTPPSAGAKSASVSIVSTAASPTSSIALTGTGYSPTAGLTLSPASLAFGNQEVTVSSAAQMITVTNTTAGAVTISSVSLAGANVPSFATSNTCVNPIPVEGSCTVSVTFDPSGVGAKSASVVIASNAASHTNSVGLSGTGVAPTTQVTVAPLSVSFGSQPVGSTSAAQLLVVTNTTGASVTVNTVGLSGLNVPAFSTTNTCGTPLAVGASCTVSVRFAPPSTGGKSAQVNIASSGSSSPAAIALTGTGVAATTALTVNPTSLSFGNQSDGTSSAAQLITVTNTTKATVTISTVSLAGANVPSFSTTNTCGAPLAVEASCSVSVIFTPPSTGAKSAAINIASTAGSSPPNVPLSGTGTSALP